MTVSRSAHAAIAIILGAVMFGVSFLAAFGMMRSNFELQREQSVTLQVLKVVRTAINEYHGANQQWPVRLQVEQLHLDLEKLLVLESVSLSLARTGKITDADLVDGWKRPLRYEADSQGFRLWSDGRDGRPGGTGLDSDLDGAQSLRDVEPTFRQFLHELCPPGMWFSSTLTGIMTAVLWLSFAPRGLGRQHGYVSVYLVATIGIALFIGLVMTFVQVPSGH